MPETVTYRTAMNLKANDEVIHCGRTRKVAGKRSRDGKIIVTFYGGSESMFNPNENL